MKRTLSYLALMVALILAGILRSAIATRLDCFHIDESYHITAGVTYARLGDYRLNPERVSQEDWKSVPPLCNPSLET